MKKFALAVVTTFALVGFVVAEEFTLQITGIGADGALTGTKGISFGGFGGGAGGFDIQGLLDKFGKGGGGGFGGFGKGEEVTVKLAPGVKVFKGKFDLEAKALVPDGADLKVAGLKSAFEQAQNGSVTVGGKVLTGSDSLDLSIKDGKPVAKLNGKDVEFGSIALKGKAPLSATVTTSDDGAITQVIIGGGGGGFGGFGGFGKKKGG